MRTKNTARKTPSSATRQRAGRSALFLRRSLPVSAFFAAVVSVGIVCSGCGGNSTAIGVTVSAASQPTAGSSPTSPVLVLKNDTETFSASVTGGSTTTVYWQICLPVPVTSPLTMPTSCTPIPGVTNSSGSSTVTGYGTITQSGLYQAPTTVPQSNSFEVMATSTVDSTAFGVNYVKIDSGIRIQMIPATAVIGAGETYAIVAQVSGTTNSAVTWSVAGTAGGNATDGTVVPGGAMCASLTLTAGQDCATYTAPPTTTTATVTATSSADPSQSADTSVTVSSGADPALASIDPTTAQQGSVGQDIYLKGANFFTTSRILVNGTPVPTTWISTDLMRTTIPSNLLSQAGSLSIVVERQNGDLSPAATLSVSAMRPSVVASSPDSVITTSAGFGVSLTGGFFSPGVTSATFDGFPGTGTGVGMANTFSSSRQMTAQIPANSLTTPGLYPLVVENSGLTAGAPSTSAANIAVTPAAGSLLTSPTATIPVGTSPSAIAVDEADGLAVVANMGANSVSIINLATNAVVTTVEVGKAPTGIAVDGDLSAITPSPLHNIAVVVNSGDSTLSTIDLVTDAVTATVPLPVLPQPQPGLPSPAYYAIGINPATHRGVVAASSTNVAAAFDVSSGTPAPPPGQSAIPLIGGSNTNYGTGPTPAVAVDPRLNWAIVTAGGGGIPVVNFVDLGRDPAGADPGRQASVVAVLGLSGEAQGVGINTETHQVLLTTPTLGNFTTFSLLDQSVSTIPFTNQNVIVNQPGYVAAAVSALPNIGVAVNANGNVAAILDLENDLVIEQVTVGNGPDAVAIDPATNEALVANQTDGTVSILSLGPVRSIAAGGSAATPQITLASPGIGYVSTSPLTLSVNGGGFASGAQVYLDGTPLPSVVNATGRQITATVPASMLASARRYSVYVENPGQAVISNIEDLTIVQSVPVGAQPFGVAIDTDCDVAAVTNSGDNTVSVVALTANAAPPGKTCVNAGAVGTVGPPIPVGTKPEGIAIDPLLGLAVVANNGGGNASVVDLTETNPPAPVDLSCGSCTQVTGVGMNLDTGVAYVTGLGSATQSNPTPAGILGSISLPTNGVPSGASSGGSIPDLDAIPQAVAVDPYLDDLGIAVGGQSINTVDIYSLQQPGQIKRPSGFNLPLGVIFDPVNQVFVAANSLQNNVGFVDPASGIASFAEVGMNPTALDYNYQASTLVTTNNQSQTMSILDYVCPPGIGTNSCPAPEVRGILALGGSPQFSVAIDPKLNLAVLTDQANNRILLIPLP
jgi:trimeric autotransporter adhesin